MPKSGLLFLPDSPSEILFQTLQSAFFQSRYLRLRDTELRGDFRLRLSLIVTPVDDLRFPGIEMLHAFLQSDQTGQLADLIVFIPDLIKQIQRIPIIVVYRLKNTDDALQ